MAAAAGVPPEPRLAPPRLPGGIRRARRAPPPVPASRALQRIPPLLLTTCLRQALGDRKGIHRFGDFTAPLDEALVHVVLDLSGRPHLRWQGEQTATGAAAAAAAAAAQQRRRSSRPAHWLTAARCCVGRHAAKASTLLPAHPSSAAPAPPKPSPLQLRRGAAHRADRQLRDAAVRALLSEPGQHQRHDAAHPAGKSLGRDRGEGPSWGRRLRGGGKARGACRGSGMW